MKLNKLNLNSYEVLLLLPSHKFSQKYRLLAKKEAHLSQKYIQLCPKIRHRLYIRLSSDEIYHSLEKQLDRANRHDSEENISRIENKIEQRRFQIIKEILAESGYNSDLHQQIRRNKEELMAMHINRLVTLMPAILKEARHLTQPLYQELDNLLKRGAEKRSPFWVQSLPPLIRYFDPSAEKSLSKAKGTNDLIRCLSRILCKKWGKYTYKTTYKYKPARTRSALYREIGTLEKNVPQLLANTLAFLKYRTDKKSVQCLKDFDLRYQNGELYKNGNFFHPACSKLYYQIDLPLKKRFDYAYATASDTIALGFQEFLRDPLSLVKSDREYADFLLANLKGEIHKRIDSSMVFKENIENFDPK